MQVKLLNKYQEHEAGTILECDEITSKELIDTKAGVEYTLEVMEIEKKEIEQQVQDILKREINKMETKESVIEVTKHAYSETQGWKNGAEFLSAVKRADSGHGVDPRLEVKAATGIGEFSGTGVNLVTPSFVSDNIFKQMMEESVFMPKMTEFKLAESASATALIKQVNETLRSNTSTFGGLRVYKVDEGSAITPSLPAFTQKSVTLAKAAVLTYISEESMRDIVNIVDQTAGIVAQSLSWQIEGDIFGTQKIDGGIASPLIGDTSVVAQVVAGAYPTAAEWFSIYNSMHPAYRQGAEWFMGTDTYASLMGLVSSGAGYPIFVKDAKEDNDGKLLGKKINIIEQATAVNTAGQIIYANPKGMALVTKENLQAAMSIHVAFLSAQNTYRWMYRYAAAPLYASKVLLPNGKYVSWAVTRDTK